MEKRKGLLILCLCICAALTLTGAAQAKVVPDESAIPQSGVGSSRLASISYDCSAQSMMVREECDALVELYNATGGESWTFGAGWGDGGDPCSWPGITCTGMNVTSIDMGGNNMIGVLPDEIGDLSKLHRLYLFSNSIAGELPDTLWNLTNLDDLELGYNEFSGTIPEDIGNLTKLELLLLNGNKFTGMLPESIGNLTSLTALDVSSNDFYGMLPVSWSGLTNLGSLEADYNPDLRGGIPTSYASLASLYMLNVDNTNIYTPEQDPTFNTWAAGLTVFNQSGVTPSFDCSKQTDSPQEECDILVALYDDTNGSSWTNNTGWLSGNPDDWYGVSTIPPDGEVISLLLNSNNLDGPLPPEMVRLASFQNLYASNNHLSGSIPEDWASNTWGLELLILSNNDMTGPLPGHLYVLPSLRILGLDSNDFSGAIPTTLGSFPALENLDITYNPLTSTIPASLGNLDTLTTLEIGEYSGISGTIPSELGNLDSVQFLYIAGTSLTGSIPDSIGNLTNLTRLDITRNSSMSGEIPETFSNLVNLETLNLYNNGISGSIPSFIGELTQLQFLSVANNGIGGTLPDSLTGLTNLQSLYLQNSSLEGPVPVAFSNLTAMDNFNLSDTSLCEYNLDSTYTTWTAGITTYSTDGDKCKPILATPLDGKKTTYQSLTFRWNALQGAASYQFELSTDPTFASGLIINNVTTATEYSVSGLDYDQTYYWRVNGKRAALQSGWSAPFSVIVTRDTWEPNDTQGAAVGDFNMATQYQQYVQGYVNSLMDEDWFSYYIEAGQCVRFWINMQYRTKSYDSADMQIVIYNPDNSLKAMNNDGGAYNDPALKVCFTETGTYTLRTKLEKGALPTADEDKTYQLMAQWLDEPTLTAPAAGAVISDRTPTFRWQAVDLAQIYDIQVATDASFTDLVFQVSVRTLTYTPTTNLDAHDTYYWRVRARNLRNIGDWSEVRIFSIP